MHNGSSVNVTDGPCVQRCTLSMCCTFSNHFIWIKPWSLFSVIKPWSLFSTLAIITLKKLSSILRLFNNAFCAYICKRMKKCKVTFNFEDVVYMLHFLKLTKFTVIFYFGLIYSCKVDHSRIFRNFSRNWLGIHNLYGILSQNLRKLGK